MADTLLEEMAAMLNSGIEPEERSDYIWEKYGKKCAVAVIDSSGFSRTTREEGIIHTLSCLAQKRQVVTPILHKHDCITYVTEADSYIALFPSVMHAMDAILESIAAVQARGIMLTDDHPYQMCAGIGYGTLLVTGGHGEFFGPEMNMASKLGEDTAGPDQLLLTEEAYAMLPDSLRSQFHKREATVSGNAILHYCMEIKM